MDAASQKNVKPVPSPQNTHKHETKSAKPQLKLTSLNKKMVQELTSQLGQDAQDCLENIKDIEVVQSTHIIEAYRDLHTKYETLPALFFSFTPEKIVYLWQINKMCPYKKDNDFALDSSSLALKTCPHLSFLLLAKIKPDDQGEIVEAKLLGDSTLYTQIKGVDGEQTIRFYNIEAFRNSARINPFAQEVLANKYYSHKIATKVYKNETDQTLYNMDISLWKRESTGPEQALTQKTLEGIPTVFSPNPFDFEVHEAHRTITDVTVLFNKYPPTIVAFKGDQLIVKMNKEIVAGPVKKPWTDFIFSDQNGKMHIVGLSDFPNIDMEKTTETLSKGLQAKVSDWEHHKNKCQKILNSFSSHYSSADAQDGLFVYKVPVSLINPYLIKDDKANQDNTEEKKEENIVEKIDKMKAEFKHAKNEQNEQNEIQEKKDLLKEIRADISAKNAEGRKFDKEYEKEEKAKQNYFSYNPKKLVPPEEVSKESLELYSEIKAEKKKLAREREKQKDDKIKRPGKNDY